MKKNIVIGLGGFLGAVCRFFVYQLNFLEKLNCEFPFDTLIINILGSFTLCFLLSMFIDVIVLEQNFKLSISTGFLGSFTTFSTFCKENIIMINNQMYVTSFIYTLFTILLGLIFSYLGYLAYRYVKSNHTEVNI